MALNEIAEALKQVHHEDRAIRKIGAQWLAFNVPSGVELQVHAALRDEEDLGIAKWLALALSRMKSRSSVHTINSKAANAYNSEAGEWLDLAASVISWNDKPNQIRSQFHSSSPLAIRQATQLIWAGLGRGVEVRPRLERLTEHGDPPVRRWAILTLSQVGLLDSPMPIIEGLNDPEYLVREWTACSLARLADPRTAIALEGRLADNHARVREWAIKALANIYTPEIGTILLAHLRRETDRECREAVYRGLASHPFPNGIRETLLAAFIHETATSTQLALIDLICARPELRNDVGFLQAAQNAAMQNDPKFVGNYLARRLYTTAAKKEKFAMDIMSKSQAVSIFYKFTQPAEQTTPNSMKETVRVGIVIALKEEFREFIQIASNVRPTNRKQQQYYFDLPGGGGSSPFGVVTLVGSKGPSPASHAARDLIENWNMDIIVSIGIAASLDNDLKMGDVIVATQVDDYIQDSKARPGTNSTDWVLVLSGDPYKTNRELALICQNLEFSHTALFRRWKSECRQDVSSYTKSRAVEMLLSKELLRTEPELFEGRVASGPIVGASSAFRNWLKQHDREYKALEMESVAVAGASWYGDGPPVLIVRGISDFGDDIKNRMEKSTKNTIRGLAMRNATRFLGQILSHIAQTGDLKR